MTSQSHKTKLKYRKELDGLRALAVLAVVLSHAKLGVPGGFIGVDVFFVISGFLITTLLWRDLDNNSYSFIEFWERRARRIFPALVVVTITTIIVGWKFMLPSDFKALGAAVVSQAGCAANIYYRRSINYFSPDSDILPMLHTWSLSVEEQFYLIIPIMLTTIYQTVGINKRVVTLSLFIIIILGSLPISVYVVNRSPTAAFYLLPTRAWELLIGSTLALISTSRTPKTRWVREIIAFGGIAGILIPCFTYSRLTPFPGVTALPPCLGTALVIWITSREQECATSTLVASILGWRPIVFVGTISYSLYLWHWPILAFHTYLNADSATIADRLCMLMLSFVLAVLSWRFVETPFRERRLCPTRRSMFASSACSLGLLLFAGTSIYLADGVPGRLPGELVAGNDSPTSYWQEVSTENIRTNRVIEFGEHETMSCVLVWGDSYAKASLVGFDACLKPKGLGGRAIAFSATAPVLGDFYSTNPFGLGRRSIEQNEAAFDYVKRHHIPNVVLVANWDLYGAAGPYPLFPDSISLEQALSITVARLREAGVQPWLMKRIPVPGFDVPRAMAQRHLLGRDIPIVYRNSMSGAVDSGQWEKLCEKLESEGCNILDPTPCFLDPTGECYMIEQEGRPLYFDKGHLTSAGSLLLVPLLRDRFAGALENGTESKRP
jgi:peptidoglycan/LPS O-acetylase OafA/YrhL